MRPILRLLAAVCIAAIGASAAAQSPVGGQTTSAPSALVPAPAPAALSAAQTAGAIPPGGGLHAGTSPPDCHTDIVGARIGAPSAYVVQLDPDTLWRPRGTEVRFTISGTGPNLPKITSVQACFRWDYKRDVDKQAEAYADSPLVRSVPNTANAVEYGALIPDFRRAASHFGESATGAYAVEYTAVFTVPVADMQVLIQLDDKTWFAVILPVGITNVPTACAVLGISLILSVIILWLWGRRVIIEQDAAYTQQSGQTFQRRSWRARINRHILAIVSTSNGVASLSQFQIMLWSFVVAGAAVYVMVLSGNLIAISDGTLTLLGIAGGTSVLARVPGPNDRRANQAAQRIMQVPHWSQMLIDDPGNPEIDVTRVQMLLFTLISAAFVAMKVATSYSIPEIPGHFLLLMGISNGVYLAGRQVPSTPKGSL